MYSGAGWLRWGPTHTNTSVTSTPQAGWWKWWRRSSIAVHRSTWYPLQDGLRLLTEMCLCCPSVLSVSTCPIQLDNTATRWRHPTHMMYWCAVGGEWGSDCESHYPGHFFLMSTILSILYIFWQLLSSWFIAWNFKLCHADSRIERALTKWKFFV